MVKAQIPVLPSDPAQPTSAALQVRHVANGKANRLACGSAPTIVVLFVALVISTTAAVVVS